MIRLLLRWGLPVLALVLAMAQMAPSFHELSSEDSVSYLDIGDAYFSGDLKAALNSYWSPLYSLILGFVLFLVRPSMELEFAIVQMTNLAIFLGALGSFEFFLCRLNSFHGSDREGSDSHRWILRVSAYSIFLWASLEWNRTTAVTPDLCMAALVYVSAGLCLGITQKESGWKDYALLGLILAFAYLAKSPLFVLSFAFLLSPLIAGGKNRKLAPPLAGIVVFLAVSAPYILGISQQKGRLTIGTAGKLNYAWKVNPDQRKIPGMHWQGGPEGSGFPLHPTRKIMDSPAVFEFAGPVGGTYPPWYDPSYWMEGLTSRFDLERQIAIIARNSFFCMKAFFPAGLLALLVLVPARTAGEIYRTLRRGLVLLIPALAALFLLMLTTDFTEPSYAPQPKTRMLAPFFVLLFCGLSGSTRSASPIMRRARTAIVLLCLLIVVWVTAGRSLKELYFEQTQERPNLLVARALKESGINPGDPVAIIGKEFRHVYWARLVKAKIICEVPWPGDHWTSAQESNVLEAMQKTGALAVVNASKIPLTTRGFRKIGQTRYEVLHFSKKE